ELDALDVGDALVPIRERLRVDRADAPMTAVVEMSHERPADEAAAAGDDDQIVLSRIALHEPIPTAATDREPTPPPTGVPRGSPGSRCAARTMGRQSPSRECAAPRRQRHCPSCP